MSPSPEQRIQIARRKALVVRMFLEGHSIPHIAKTVEASERLVLSDLRTKGLCTVDDLRKQREKYVQNRRERITDLVNEGLSSGEISERTGWSKSLVVHERKVMGIQTTAGGVTESRKQKYREAVDARRAKLQKMHARGASVQSMSEKFEVSAYTIKKDLRALGLNNSRSVQLCNDELLEEFKWLIDGGVSSESAKKKLNLSDARMKQFCKALQ